MRKLLLLFFIQTGLYAQSSFKDQLKLTSKVGTIVASENTPFLLRSNQYGLLPLEANLLYLNTSLKKDYDTLTKKWDYGFGVEPHINVAKNTQFFLPEAYIKGRWKSLELYAGRKREIVGLVDSVGTMGSFIWSGNALPVPKIDIGFRDFVSITKGGLLAIKGNFAHGWLGSGDSVQNVLLHQKSLYIRVGKPDWKIKVYGGINHQVQWGGRPSKPFYDELSKQTISKFGSNFPSYIQVVTGVSLSNLGPWDSQSGEFSNEAMNRRGNHLGSVDVGIDFLLSKSRVFLYRQSIYEDGSLFYLNNINDGLFGFSVRNISKSLKLLCFEYLNTQNQGGSTFLNQAPELRGRDNYFNNSVYKDGWIYRGNTIGSGYLIPIKDNNVLGIVNNNTNTYSGVNSRIKVLSINTVLIVANKIQLDIELRRYHSENNDFEELGIFKKNFFLTGIRYKYINFRLSGEIGKNSNVGLHIAYTKQFNL